MGNFLKALAKVGLVELEGEEQAAAAAKEEMSEEDIRKLLDETKALGGDKKEQAPPAASPTTPVAAPVTTPVAPTTDIKEGRELASIYGEVGIPPSPFPAEKLLKLLDGLKAMDERTRKQAIIAMDQADEAWTIEDAILDANRKVEALRSAQQALRAGLETAEAQAQKELEAQDTYQHEATKTIREQIADLEATLQKEVETVANEKAAIKARIEADRGAAKREEARLEAEVQRLADIGRIFQAEGS